MVRKRKKTNKRFHPYLIGIAVLILLTSVLYVFRLGIFEEPCANSLSCKESLTLKVENNKEGIFLNQKVSVPEINLAKDQAQTMVLGADEESQKSIDSNGTEKHIYVNLTTQTLSAYEGDKLFMRTPISSGLWGRTPTGEFTIWVKLRSTTMSGGSGDDYYYLPNVPYVMFFSNDKVAASRGFSLHGTYWHNNFGHPMSHGCVNMKTSDVAKLYEWANPATKGRTTHSSKADPGTKITIYEES